MTFTKTHKSLGVLTLTVIMAASFSVSAFAQSPSSPSASTSIKSIPSSVTSTESSKSAAYSITDSALPAGSSAATTTSIEVRTNDKTGKMEISEDNGKTWKEYDGKAMALTPAQPGTKPAEAGAKATKSGGNATKAGGNATKAAQVVTKQVAK